MIVTVIYFKLRKTFEVLFGMKTILCYGDSNTWGLNYQGGRFLPEKRWTNVMQRELGEGFYVVEEGLNGRTAGQDDPDDDCPEAKNGRKFLIPCLRSHFPLDLVILMLGTNDLKVHFFLSVDKVADDIGVLIRTTRAELRTRQGYEPEILLVAPTIIGDTIENSVFRDAFGGRRAIRPSVELADALRKTAERNACHFLNAAAVAAPNPVDAIHLTQEGHCRLGREAARKVREIFA